MAKLKLVKTSPCSSIYLSQFYAHRPGLANLSYNEQYSALMGDCFAAADFWKLNLESAGECEVTEVVFNAKHLQEQWWRENVRKPIPLSPLDILEEQLLHAEPDVWFCHAYEIPPAFRARIRRRLPRLKLIVGEDGVAWHDPAHFAGCDIVLTCLKRTEDFYKSKGFDAYRMGSGFESRIAQKVGKQEVKIPLCFVGGGWMGKQGHFSRLHFLDQLALKTDITLHLSGLTSKTEMLKRLAYYLKKGDLSSFRNVAGAFGIRRRLSALAKAPIFGLEMYRCLAQSNIVLNYHIDAAGNEAANMRLYEATGMGACLLTDYKPNIDQIFKPDEEIVVFKSIAECLEKIKYLERHPEERNRIAAAGKKRTSRDYSLEKLIKKFFAYCVNKL